MRDDTPSVYLLAGPAGPAKAAYVRALEDRGIDAVPTGTAEEVEASLIAHVEAGRDVFIDDELAEPGERARCKALVEAHGGQWCLINFTVDHTPLAGRLEGVAVREGVTDRG
jgi:hypothetical protein